MKFKTVVLAAGFVMTMSHTLHAAFCDVNVSSISFGNYDVFSTAPLSSTGYISVTCRGQNHKPLAITASITSGGSGGFCPRKMRNSGGGGDLLDYDIFTDASMTNVWGDGTACSSTVPASTTGNGLWNSVMYGRIPAGQDVAAGPYSDTVTVTVTW